jgi:hypothetical protein
MALMKSNVIFGQRIKRDENGPRRVHVHTFSGLLTGADHDPLAEAYGMLVDYGADYGEPHPIIPGLYVIDIDGETYNNTPSQAKFVVTYGQPQWGSINQMVITITTSVGRRMVRFDKYGYPITVNYTPGGTGLPAVIGDFAIKSGSVIGEVPKLEAHTVVEYEFENGDPPPRGLAGSVSTAKWNGAAKWLWACREVTARKMVATTNWRIKYAFEYDPDGWHKVSIYRDPLTSLIPVDVDPVVITAAEGNGWFRPEVNDFWDFNQLTPKLPEVWTT